MNLLNQLKLLRNNQKLISIWAVVNKLDETAKAINNKTQSVEAKCMNKQFFPIGSVVMLEGGEKRLMIYGILPVNGGDSKTYDYIGCLYPEGFIDNEHCFLFNSEDIKSVEFVGYVDIEQQEFQAKISAMLSEEN